MKKHIIFDFDDTIASAYEHNQQLFVDTFLPYKRDIDQDYVRKVHYVSRGKAMDLQFAEVIKKFNLNLSVEKLVKENELMHQKRAGEVKVFNRFEETLSYFKKLGKIISLCTNRAEGSLKIILKKNKLDQYFDNVISCKDARHEKPDPYCLTHLLKKYPSINKKEVIYFGDSKTDAEFAQNAGIDYLVIDHYLNQKQFYIFTLDSFAGVEDELLVEVDKNNKDIGSIFKMEAYTNPSRFHRSVHIVLFNTKGKIVLQKRSETKMYEPGAWDVIGGFQSYGKTVDETAGAEVFEEVGITPELHFKKIILRKDQGAFYSIYYTVHDGPYRIDNHEVKEVKEFDCQKLLDHKYDQKYNILKHVYRYVKMFKKVWIPLKDK